MVVLIAQCFILGGWRGEGGEGAGGVGGISPHRVDNQLTSQCFKLSSLEQTRQVDREDEKNTRWRMDGWMDGGEGVDVWVQDVGCRFCPIDSQEQTVDF